jgi:calpain-15
MKTALKPEFGDDGTFWMCFKDFVENFRALNVCKVSDWDEVRVKGEFTCKLAEFDTLVRSKYYYELNIPAST